MPRLCGIMHARESSHAGKGTSNLGTAYITTCSLSASVTHCPIRTAAFKLERAERRICKAIVSGFSEIGTQHADKSNDNLGSSPRDLFSGFDWLRLSNDRMRNLCIENWHVRINSHALHFNAGPSTQSLEVPIL